MFAPVIFYSMIKYVDNKLPYARFISIMLASVPAYPALLIYCQLPFESPLYSLLNNRNIQSLLLGRY